MLKATRICSSAIVLLLAIGCGSDDDDGGSTSTSIVDELTAAGIGQYLDIVPASMVQNGAWEEYTYDTADETAICLRGTAYQANLRRGSTNKVLLYLEGGGACWSTGTCWGPAPIAKLTAGPASTLGILDLSNPDNPFRDWNVVYAPYCDGSVFAGDNIADYDGNRTYHHGQQNIGAAVGLMQREFPDPGQIVVAGSSAGGYGTYTAYGTTRVAYPEAPILVFDDSGPGLQDPADTEVNAERENNWLFRQFIPASCTDCETQLTYLTEWTLERDPTLRAAYFNYLQDNTLRFFLSLDAGGFEALLKDVTGDIQSRWPERFKRYFKQGDSHTVLELPSFYSEEIAGLSILDWTADFLTDGPAWQDTVEPFNPFAGFSSERYANDSLWLCRPGLADDQCFTNDITATLVRPDNSQVVEVWGVPATDPGFDCFYVYPTVDLSPVPGNHTDFSDIGYELDALLSQAARFRGLCRVFAPLYRQVTLGTFGSPNAEQYVELAYSDVREAFRHYMGQYNNGRNFVIMGHSQGTGMVTELLRDEIDLVPELRARLIVALLIGGGVEVPDGETVGGTFQNIPLCTATDQTGCAIAYRSYAEGYPPEDGSNGDGPGEMDTACTNPAALAGGKGRFKGSYFPLHVNQPAFDVNPDPMGIETPFLLYEDFYAGECIKDDRNRSYLEISVEPASGDLRENRVPFDHPLFAPDFLGTHVLDYNFALVDLLDLVAEKAAAMP